MLDFQVLKKNTLFCLLTNKNFISKHISNKYNDTLEQLC